MTHIQTLQDSELDRQIDQSSGDRLELLLSERSRRLRREAAYADGTIKTVPITRAQHFYLAERVWDNIDEASNTEMWDDLHVFGSVTLLKTRLRAPVGFLLRLADFVDPEAWAEEMTDPDMETEQQYAFAYQRILTSIQTLEERLTKAALS